MFPEECMRKHILQLLNEVDETWSTSNAKHTSKHVKVGFKQIFSDTLSLKTFREMKERNSFRFVCEVDLRLCVKLSSGGSSVWPIPCSAV